MGQLRSAVWYSIGFVTAGWVAAGLAEPVSSPFIDAASALALVRFYVVVAALVSGVTFGVVLAREGTSAHSLVAAIVGALTFVTCMVALPDLLRPMAELVNLPVLPVVVGMILVSPYVVAKVIAWRRRAA